MLRNIISNLSLILLLIGCSSSNGPETEAKELPVKNAPKIDINATEEDLFNSGKQYYSSGLYSIAKDSFQSLISRYPSGAYSSFAEIKIADAELQGNNFGPAATLYEQFVENHPSSLEVPYALFRAAQSHLLSSKGEGRDPAPLEKALAASEKLLSSYPKSPYSGAGREVQKMVVERLATHEKLVRDYYAKKNSEKAALARNQVVEEKWQRLLNSLESDRTTENQAPTIPAEISKTALARAATPPEIIEAVSESTEPPRGTISESPGRASAVYRIQKAVCKDDTVYLYVNKPFELKNFIEQRQDIKNEDNVLGVIIPSTSGPGIVVSCFAEKDLILGADGIVSLKTDREGSLMTLDYPPRLVLRLK